jgi:hypothetical protein
MALAPFFEKSNLAIAQALGRFDTLALLDRLERCVPALAFDALASRAAEGRVTAELTVNLLARLYPRLVIRGLDADAAVREDALRALALSINPNIAISRELSEAGFVVGIGTTAIARDVPTIYAGSEGWTVRLNPSQPVGCGDSDVPFAGAAAACIAAANVFRYFFRDSLEAGDLDGAVELSLSTLQHTADSNPPPAILDIGEWHLVGAGAIGSAVLWALRRSPVTGQVDVIDPELADLSNLQRYILLTQRDVGRPKAPTAELLFRGSAIRVQGHEKRWGEYLATRADWSLGRVAVALDTGLGRIEVQASLPKRVLNAWTQRGELGVSRHGFLGADACLACLYLPTVPAKSEDEVVAEALGLRDHLMEIRALLYNGAPVSRELLQRAATALQVPLDPLLRFENRPLRAFYSEGICGGLVLSLSGTRPEASERGTETPLAFQSALAGILLAAEMVLESQGLRPLGFPVRTSMDVLRPIPAEISFHYKKKAGSNCLCQDGDFVNRYIAKHGHDAGGSLGSC